VQKYHLGDAFNEKIVTCKRDPEARDRDKTEAFDFLSETLGKCVYS